MAGLPLNNFKTVTFDVTASLDEVYEAPLGFKSVFLLAQITNTGGNPYNVTFQFGRGGIFTDIVSSFTIPSNDTLNLLTGKLVLETGDVIRVSGTAPGAELKFIASILETSA
jgi:hypothetical protein